tara:strand:+ start:489 stop:2654 length:2166 start_codon:yes stop_codon:yes gene_type:complete
MDRIDEILFLYEDDVVEMADGGRIGFGKAGFVRSKGYRGYVSDERLKLEKKLPEIKKLYLEGLNDRGIAKKLNTTKKRIEVILDELRGKAVTNIGGKKVKSGYNIPEDTPRGKLYKANRITKAEEKARGRGGSGGITSPKSKAIIKAAKEDASKLTPTEIETKYKISPVTQKKLGIKAIPDREKYKDKYIKPTITKYGKNLMRVLEKNPSLITNQNELFKKAKVPKNASSSVVRALNINQTLDSGKKRFDIPKSISKLIPKIYGPVETAESVFREAGASPQEIKSALTRPGVALKESFIPEGSGPTKMKGTIFEHAFPRALIPYIKNKNIQRQLLLTGERTSPFLNSFKTRFDVLQKGAVTKFLEDGNLSAYNKKINEIRNTVKKLTGGYEIGYIKFDKNKNATPMVKAKPVSDGLKEFGTETTQKVSAFKNAKYTSNLLKNFKKNPNNINYSTLRKDINVNQVSDEVIKLSDEAAKAYEKAKPFLGLKDKFLNFAQKNLNNKLVGTLFKAPTGKIGLITGAVLLPTALAADEAQAADGTEARSILPEVAGGAAAGSLAFKPVRQGVKKGLKATGRVLGKLAVPIGLGAEAYFAKQAYDEGKSIPEIMAAPFLLDSKVRQTQDMLSMKPEERQAINRQMIEDDISGLSSDFETPRKEGVDEVDIVEVLKRVQKKRMADEARRREERAGGGIAGIRRPNAIPPESGPNSQGLENLKYYVTNT